MNEKTTSLTWVNALGTILNKLGRLHAQEIVSAMPNSSGLRDELKHQLRRHWALASGIGAVLGAGAAVLVFPGAAVMQNPTGEFGWHLVGFAFLVGLGFALGQWVVLTKLTAQHLGSNPSLVRLWIPASTVAIMAMLLPLWWVPAGFLLWFPWLIAQKILPGILALAILQWLILMRLMSAGPKWIFVTVLGSVVGATLGIFWILLLLPLSGIPGLAQAIEAIANATFEMGWAFVTGGMIGLFQAGELAKAIGIAVENTQGE